MKQTYRVIINGLLILAVSLFSLPVRPATAGEPPGGVIGPMNPTMYSCREGDGDQEEYQPDPFIKETAFRFVVGGRLIGFDETDNDGDFYFDGGPALLDPEFRDEYYVTELGNLSEDNDRTERDDRIEYYASQDQTCDNRVAVDFGFDTKDAVLYESYLSKLKRACDKAGGTLIPIEDTRIEGFVYEFHEGADGEWFSVPSRDVPVHLSGITFDLEWGTDDKGYYYFSNLGAGPMVVNLRLPPDAHPINPNVVLFSSGLDSGKDGEFPSLTVFMGFYRGDKAPPDVAALRTPAGNALPFSSQSALDTLRMCGYLGTPSSGHIPTEIMDMSFAIPHVGGTPPPDDPSGVIALSLGLVTLLVAAGGATLYRQRYFV